MLVLLVVQFEQMFHSAGMNMGTVRADVLIKVQVLIVVQFEQMFHSAGIYSGAVRADVS